MSNNLERFKKWIINKAVTEREVQAATARGLVPASGNPYEPYRWIKEGEQQSQEDGQQNSNDEHSFTIEDVFSNHDEHNIDSILENIERSNENLKNSGDEGAESILENNNRIAYLFNGVKKYGSEPIDELEIPKIDNIAETLQEISDFSDYLTEIGEYITDNYDDVSDSFHNSITQYKHKVNENYSIVNDRKNKLNDMHYGYDSLFPYHSDLFDNIEESIESVLSEPQTEDIKNILYQNSQTIRVARALKISYDIEDNFEEPTYDGVASEVKDLIFALGEMKNIAIKYKNDKEPEKAEMAQGYVMDINDVLGEKEELLDSLEPQDEEEEMENNIEFFSNGIDFNREITIADRMIRDIDEDDLDEKNAVKFIQRALIDLEEDLDNGEMQGYRGVKDNDGRVQSFAKISHDYYPSGKEFHIDKIVTMPSLYRQRGQSPSGGIGAGPGVKLLTDIMAEFIDSDSDYAVLEPLNEHVMRGYRRFGFKGEEWDIDMVAQREDALKSMQRMSKYIKPRLEETGMSHILDRVKKSTIGMLYKESIMQQIYDLGKGNSQWMPIYNINSPLFGTYILVRKGMDGKSKNRKLICVIIYIL